MKPLIEDAKHPTVVTHVIFDMDGLLIGEYINVTLVHFLFGSQTLKVITRSV